jgi:choline dehydrogenase-like flavoprotein
LQYDYDVIVVGGGAGGATFAYGCARAGKSVLLLERGSRYTQNGPMHDEKAMMIDKRPYDDREVAVNGHSKRLYMGGILGGGTSLYGGALVRPSEQDFQPGRYYGRRIPRAIWDWPISYSDLEPYYTEAERLYTDSSKCLSCGVCAGYICPTGARSSSAQLLEKAIAAGYPIKIQTQVEVERLVTEPRTGATLISVLDRISGRRMQYRARRYALGGGAIGSSLLLLRSGIEHPMIGRNYMMHLCSVVVGIYPHASRAESSFIKQVGFADFYFGTKKYPHKMGLVQSLPVPGPLMTRKMSPFVPEPVRQFLRQRVLPLAGLIEDLPNPANRVTLGSSGQVKLTHRFGKYDVARRRRMKPLVAKILKRSGAVYCVSRHHPTDEYVAHQCGTLRSGTDAAHAVLDADCRMFANPNIFAVDGSFLPTSLGVGPGLTIMANALRVADTVAAEI